MRSDNDDDARKAGTRSGDLLDAGHLREGLKKKALVGAGFSVFAQTFNYGVQTVGTIILARILSPEDFGLVSMVATFSILVQNFGLNGFTEAIIQKRDLTDDQMRKLFWVNALIMIGLTVFFVAISPAIAWFFGEAQLKSISAGMALSIIFSGLGTCHLALLSRNMKFNLSAIAQVLAAVISTGLSIAMAVGGFGFWSLVARRVSLPLVTTLFAWLFCRWKPGAPAKGTSIRSILTFGYKTYGNYLLGYLRNNLDKIFVGRAFGKTPLGHYDRASQLSSVLPNQLTVALSGVGIATLSRLVDDPPKYRTYFSKALSVLAFIGFPGSALFTILGKDIIIILLGDRWSIAGSIFAALGPGIGAFVIYNTNVWLHISLGRADRLLKWGFIVLGVSLGAYFIGLQFGPYGVAIAYSVMFYVLLIPALSYAGRPAGIGARFCVGILWRYWAAATVSSLLFWAVFDKIQPLAVFYGGLSPLVRIAIGTAAYPAFYLAAVIALFGGLKPILMFRGLIRDMLAR
ncbi:MAG: lipopolysaccharide biosynthesis protein [Acidobacteriota bacterium]